MRVLLTTRWPISEVHLASARLDPLFVSTSAFIHGIRFSEVLETLLLLQICRLHHDVNLLFHHILLLLLDTDLVTVEAV